MCDKFLDTLYVRQDQDEIRGLFKTEKEGPVFVNYGDVETSAIIGENKSDEY